MLNFLQSSWNICRVCVEIETFSVFQQETDRLSDEDLYKFLNDLKKPSAGVLRKQQKMLPGQCPLAPTPTAVSTVFCCSNSTVVVINSQT